MVAWRARLKMSSRFYQTLEGITATTRVSLQDCVDRLRFNAQGLIPVIAQCHKSGQVLMQAWMNKTALERTLATQQMTYWSRSRSAFWVKGQTSGHGQKLIAMYFDCDGDAVLCRVEQTGGACHTGRPSCFYLQVDANQNQVRLTNADSNE